LLRDRRPRSATRGSCQGGFCDVYIDHAWPTLETNMRRFLAGDIGGMVNVVPH
jgi:hypothetical protein